MDLAYPLRTLTPSLDSAVLEVLCRTEEGLSASQISRLAARGSRAGHRPVLERLVDHGLVLAHPANTGYLYRLNRAHVLAPAVLAAADARGELLSRLQAAFTAVGAIVSHASVFGSFARRKAGPDSDVDLLIVLADGVDPHGSVWEGHHHALVSDVLAWTGNRAEVLTFTPTKFARAAQAGEPVLRTWATDAITVHGPLPATLLAAAEAA